MVKWFRRAGVVLAACVLAAVLVAPRPAKAIVVLEYLLLQTLIELTPGYTFTGNCSDCTGQATAILKLTNYTPGTAIQASNFLWFRYNPTDLFAGLTVSAMPGDTPLTSISGLLPASLPSAADVTIVAGGFTFSTISEGNWNIGPTNGSDDFGGVHSWAAPAAAVSAPAALPLLLVGLLGLGAVRRGRRAS
ncbi:hypothetical protein [Falsiroseomonas oryzae]|uniref:hypothetical protein n=1 Tax=Falsiroseomonas oryzae TaxID=2766473 RepID=UPI0022EA7FB4|nr:hypothetical protein [Roseomonas sp. MO-31]